MSSIHRVWLRTRPTCTSSLMRLRRGELADDVAARRRRRRRRGRSGAPGPPSTSLPTVRISFTPGAALATKSNVRASGPIRATSGSLSWRLQVLLQRLLGVHRHRRRGRAAPRGARSASARSRRSRPGCPWRRPRTRACACPARRPAGPSAAAMRGLADAALAGDEQQPAVEQLEVGSGAIRSAPKPMRRSASGLPIST